LDKRVIPRKNNLSKLENAADTYLQLKTKDEQILCLFPTNSDANDFNNIITERMNIKTTTINAVDTERQARNFLLKEPNYKKNKKAVRTKPKLSVIKTAGLEQILTIGIGSQIMLRRNLDTEIGLVNGAIGTVMGLVYGKSTPEIVQKIIIKFQQITEFIEIERYSADYEIYARNFISRSQFPLTSAWGISIHKSQGLTLKSVMLDLGENIFEGGMAYVALSRCRLLDNVHIIEFDPFFIVL